MKNFKLKNIIEKYLAGEQTKEENELLNMFYGSYDEDSQGITTTSKENIKKKARAEIFRKTGIRHHKPKFFHTRYTGVAASIIFFMLLATGVLYYSGLFDSKPVITWGEKTTQIGERSTLTFLDGTKIILSGGSKLKYNPHANGEVREVYLEGEAYFKVAHLHNKPFIVHSGNVSTTVLGTKFDVKAFPGEKEIKVSLVEGSVKVTSSKKNGDNNVVKLAPNEQLTFDKEMDVTTVGTFDIDETIGWKQNILKFNEHQLGDVFKRLERTFGIKFELADTNFTTRKFTGYFDNDSFWTIVKVIKSLTGLQYKTIEDNNKINKIVFF